MQLKHASCRCADNAKILGKRRKTLLPINALQLTFLMAVCCTEEDERMCLHLKEYKGLTGVKERSVQQASNMSLCCSGIQIGTSEHLMQWY